MLINFLKVTEQLVKMFCALLCSFILIGCTQQRLAMRFADTAASWKADDYFDLTGAQKNEVKKLLRTFLKEAYENNDREIPKTFDRADRILAEASDNGKLDCKQIEDIKDQVGLIFHRLGNVGAPHVQRLVEKLSEKQIQYFVRQVVEKIEEDELESEKIVDREKLRLQRSLDSIRLFLGSLSPEQTAAIQTHAKAKSFPFDEQAKSRRVILEKLRTASATTESFKQFIVDYVQNWRSYQSVSFLKQVDELRSQNDRFYQNLICGASSEQLTHLRQKLSSVKKDFEEFFIE